MGRTSSCSRRSTTASRVRPMRRSGRPTDSRSRFTATSPARCRSSCSTCGRAPYGNSPRPAQPGPQANADSIAAAERARQDSIARAEADARAREEAERVARQRAADSLAAMGHTTEAVRTMLAAMIHFDFDKANIRPVDAGTLDQKVGILQANHNLRIRISGHCDERGSDEYKLALGNRRATAAKQYTGSNGLEAGN